MSNVNSTPRLVLMTLISAVLCALPVQAAVDLSGSATQREAIKTHQGKGSLSEQSTVSVIRFRPTTPPPDRGTPRAPHGTGSRGDCSQSLDLPPLSQLVGSQGLELTVSEHPQFWVYVPYAQPDVATAKFSLQSGDTEVYQQAIQLPGTPGIVAIAMPTTLPPLEIDRSYQWYFELTCPQSDATETPTPAAVTGKVQRIAPSATLLASLAIAQSPLETIEAYAENQIWYETLAQLAQLRLSNPNEERLTEIWQTLLSDPAVGLDRWATVPFAGETVELEP